MVEETEETDSIVQPKKLPLIDVSELTQFAIDSYSETPKFMTIVRHADDGEIERLLGDVEPGLRALGADVVANPGLILATGVRAQARDADD
jgi:hypothetical protein